MKAKIGKPAIRNIQKRTYQTPDGYQNAMRQLTRQGYNYFLPVKVTRRTSVMLIGKVNMPRSQATLH